MNEAKNMLTVVDGEKKIVFGLLSRTALKIRR